SDEARQSAGTDDSRAVAVASAASDQRTRPVVGVSHRGRSRAGTARNRKAMSEPLSESRAVTTPELPTVILKPRHALPFFKRNPWVFAGAIRAVHGDPHAGGEVA